ncbi:hypothetical protein MQE36_08325 [Zhouia spongiae]|uniref:DUF4221 domain-containing protein n=1 Tax=Zhouia spongiae TaxID=2202721 RepID=A0ABY3YRQ5_9FLAO|nr:putative HNHc nuclease [Zhouia spongiae]UNZ00331.1 hypothetical protein MQE36_08325 [Zhouia spongiae]
MKQTESKKLKSYLKSTLLITLSLLLFNCSNDDGNENTPSQSKSKLLAIDGMGSDLKIVEVNPDRGLSISTFLDFEPMQASVDFDFTYFNTTNQLFIRRNVYENGIGPQIIKVNIDTREEITISSENYSTIIAGNGKLFGFERIVDNTELKSINLVEIDPENASKMSTIEIFEAIESAPSNDKTGISGILYSYDTNELLIPRRTSFVSNAIDQLIKINANSGTKKTVNINHYESITVGRNGRIFAVKRTYDPNLGEFTFYGIVEVNINNGQEIEILKEFDNLNSFSDSEIIYLSETNEVLVDIGTLYKINVNTKTESILDNSSGFYSYRSINIY